MPGRFSSYSLSSSILMPSTTSIAPLVRGASTQRESCPNTSPILIHGDRLHKPKPSHFSLTETSCLSGMLQTRPSPSVMKVMKIRLNLYRHHQILRYQRLLHLQRENLATGKRNGEKTKCRVTPTHESADLVKSTEPGGPAEPGDVLNLGILLKLLNLLPPITGTSY